MNITEKQGQLLLENYANYNENEISYDEYERVKNLILTDKAV